MRTTSKGGRHVGKGRLRSPGTWVAALAALVLSAAVALAMTPAQASSTVEVQLTLSGVASPDNPTGGSRVGVHPGDTVVMHASSVPTAGAPAGLSGALSGLVGGLANLQVKILSGNNLPGLRGKAFTLRAQSNCAGSKNSLALRSLAKGTYSFRYVVQRVDLVNVVLGLLTKKKCQANAVTPTQDQLGTLTQNNVKVTDNAVYSGSIVVANNPPSGQIGVQLPKQSVSVKAGPLHTSVNLPGATVGVPNPVPGITKGLGKLPGQAGGGGPKSGNGGGSGGNVNYTPPSLTVPQEVMPHAVNYGGAKGVQYAAPAAGHIGGHIVAARAQPTATASPVAHPSNVANAESANKTVDLGSKGGSSGLLGKELPVVLAILAILALSLVTAGYARMVLLRRH